MPEDPRKECCRDEENLGEVEQVDDSTTLRRCKVCGCRHFDMTVDPGEIGVRMS
jgi:hypothetical protein